MRDVRDELLEILAHFFIWAMSNTDRVGEDCPFEDTEYEDADCRGLCGVFFPQIDDHGRLELTCPCLYFPKAENVCALDKLEELLRKEGWIK